MGTAQFGLAYGINSGHKQMCRQEVFSVMEEAARSWVDILDTAHAYGSSEELIGEFFKEHNRGRCFEIISKLPKCSFDEARDKIRLSLERTHAESLYGYLLHDFNMYREDPGVWDFFLSLRDKGIVKKIGASVYYPKDLELMLDKHLSLDMVQVPYNIFDRRFEDYFELLYRRNIEIYARSIFLQGLFFIKPQNLNNHFFKIKEKIVYLNKFSQEKGIGILSVCLNFVLLNKYIDKVVVGVDNLVHFKEIMGSLILGPQVKMMHAELFGLKEDDQEILLPFNWKLGKN